MLKLFSSNSRSYQEKIFSVLDECHENGTAEYNEDGDQLMFTEAENGDVIVEDQANGNEVTRISSNPEDEDDFVVTAEDVDGSVEDPEGEGREFCGDRTYSEDALPSIEITRLPGKDGEDMSPEEALPEISIDINTGIESDEKSGTNVYSLKFKNYSEKAARRFAKIFSEVVSPLDDIVKSANIDEDVKVEVNDEGEVKVMSVHVGTKKFSDPTEDPTEEPTEAPTEEPTQEPTEEPTEAPTEGDPKAEADSLVDRANDLVEMVGDGVTKENAAQVKDAAEEILVAAEKLESKGCNMRMLKLMCNKFSEEAASVMDETEEPTEEPTEAPTEDPEMSRTFSEGDPKVTVTIDNLEPASVASLLSPVGVNEEKETEPEPESDLAPSVNPNEGEGRQFSTTGTSKYENPLLYTEIK